MKYKDLDLRAIMEAENLDFAHWTYQRGQCSCCYGPEDQPKRYWRNGDRPEDVYGYPGLDVQTRKPIFHFVKIWKGKRYDYSARTILFKNANNGSGTVRRNDEIRYDYIEYNLDDMAQVQRVCNLLQQQLGEEYEVVCPDDMMRCIKIKRKELAA